MRTAMQINEQFDMIVKPKRADGLIVEGLQIGEVTHQNQALLLLCQKGEIKEYPSVGVGIENICNDNELVLWKQEIALQMEGDGMRIEKLQITDKELKLEAKYV